MSEPGFRRVLALDCSGAACSAALWLDGALAAERFAAMERGQAETLMPQIAEIMAETGTAFSALDAIATTVGPGSFTGLRLGLAATRGLALAADRPILAMTSFEALLAGLDPLTATGRKVAVALDSRRGPVFAQLFDTDRTPLGPPLSLEPDEIDAWLPDEPLVILADAGAALTPRPDRNVHRAAIRAGAMARFAAQLGPAALGRLAPTPLYLRAPDVSLPKQRGAP
jgi:tRNA threonylcarbamoyladenosine biosynthesis protein TsaB